VPSEETKSDAGDSAFVSLNTQYEGCQLQHVLVKLERSAHVLRKFGETAQDIHATFIQRTRIFAERQSWRARVKIHMCEPHGDRKRTIAG